MIADDRGSQIADRRRSQRQLFPYNRGRSRTIAKPTFAYISVSGSVKITGALRLRENRIKTTLVGDEELSSVPAGVSDLKFVLDGLCAICGLSHCRF